MSRVTVWADWLGVWRASVPLSQSRHADAMVARRAIQAELSVWYAPNYDPRTLHVTRERVTNHGTAIYVGKLVARFETETNTMGQ